MTESCTLTQLTDGTAVELKRNTRFWLQSLATVTCAVAVCLCLLEIENGKYTQKINVVSES